MKRTYSLLLLLLLISQAAMAEGIASLIFHMGMGANGRYFVGGTISNTGDKDISRGYIVILPITEKCEPESFILYEYSRLVSGSSIEFRIRVTGKLVAYRLAGLGAVDDMGYSLKVIDKTKAVSDDRRSKDEYNCLVKRRKVHK